MIHYVMVEKVVYTLCVLALYLHNRKQDPTYPEPLREATEMARNIMTRCGWYQ